MFLCPSLITFIQIVDNQHICSVIYICESILLNNLPIQFMVQCQPQLNREIQPFVVEGVHFTHCKDIKNVMEEVHFYGT